MTETPEDPAALASLLTENGVPESFVARAAARLGPDAAGRLRADPWLLLAVPGVAPHAADHFARRVLGDQARPDDPRRGRALVGHLLTEEARQGHTVTPPAEVVSALERLRVDDPARAIEAALGGAEVLALTEEPEFDEAAFEDDAAELPEPEETLGLARWALAEEAAAEGFQRLNATAVPLLDDVAIKEARSGLPEDRSLALTAALRTGVCVLRGTGPDLEETALMIVAAASERGLRAAVAAPTERAAAALAGASGLHALLEPGEGRGTVAFGRGEERPLELDLLVVTDAAGLDVEMCAVLVQACADGTHLVLGGEPGALPPGGPGRVLDDLESSEIVPAIELEPRGPGGPLATLVAAVRGGELVAVEAPDREVVIVPAGGAEEAAHRAVQLVTDSIPRALGIPVEDVQVITSGSAAAAALNAALKARINPGPGAFGGFDPGDRVVVTSPLPQGAVGEPGVVTGATAEGLEIDFSGRAAVVAPVQTARLRHGWALPVALGRGTPRPAVVALLEDEGLSRPLVGTALGLARRHLSIVQAAGPALARAVRDVEAPPRRTRLAKLVVQ
ncbi:helix-hairpin-helix domain-containing protein [Spirillospora sp. CA-294931]|uniref:helix-hairpin-helix domain-containing protein n=1 Tax=Spirillospora sp. CA-294931 TaxID=3240042 RepID=UPI003D93830F